jgi:hypothetical protein
MDLDKKIEEVTAAPSQPTVRINTLTVGCPYSITSAERVRTRYGPTVLLGIVCNSDLIQAKVYLPRRYSQTIKDSDIDGINMARVRLSVIYRGICTVTKAIMLEVEKQT